MTLNEARQQGIAPWDSLLRDEAGFQVFWDRYPVSEGHLLFVPKSDDPNNIKECFGAALDLGNHLVEQGQCDAFNVGINCGREAGQTVMYPHVHLIPRRAGDCEDPVGGVRGVIPGQANYRKDTYRGIDNA